MAFFDKLNDLANTATEKASCAIESGKTAISINREEKKINEYTCKIGEIVVQRLDCGMEPDSEISPLYDCIIAAREEIERLKCQQGDDGAWHPIEDEQIICCSCGCSNPPGTNFCGRCGAKL